MELADGSMIIKKKHENQFLNTKKFGRPSAAETELTRGEGVLSRGGVFSRISVDGKSVYNAV